MDGKPNEEPANALTHGLGILLSIIGGIFLVQKAIALDDSLFLYSVIIYSFAITFLFSASTLYHSFQQPRLKKLLQIFDHVGIYLMIAGTYTPFMMITIADNWGGVMLKIVWAIALLGIIFKIFFTGKFRLFSTLLYVGMGWIAVLVIKPMLDALSAEGLALILGGGVCFSIGVFFYLRGNKHAYNHAIWHLFVLAGGVCHYFAIFLYAYTK